MTELVRSALPPAALRALRLVCRAARDHLVDGRCRTLTFRLRAASCPRPALPATKALVGLAGRLRSLTRLDAAGCGSDDVDAWGVPLLLEDCDDLAAAIKRLPNPSALTALDLGCISVAYDRRRRRCTLQQSRAPLRRLGAAVGRCQSLRALRFEAHDGPADAAHACLVALLLAAASPRLPALAELSAAYSDQQGCGSVFLSRGLLERPPLLRRLEALELRQTLPWLLDAPLAPAAAAHLTALRALRLDAGVYASDYAIAALWRAPRELLARLTHLAVAGLDPSDEAAAMFFGALETAVAEAAAAPAAPPAPPLLGSIRTLRIGLALLCESPEHSGLISPGALRTLLAAVNPSALEALLLDSCQEGCAEVLAARAGAFTALRRLRLDGRDFSLSLTTDGRVRMDCNRPAAHWRAMQEAPFPPLRSLDIGCGTWLLRRPKRLPALLSAPWAAALAELKLFGGDGAHYPDGVAIPAHALEALSKLPALRRLRFDNVGVTAAALDEAAERGWLAGLAERLAELHITDRVMDADALAALGDVPFERLQRLTLRLRDRAMAMSDLEALAAAGAEAGWLARLPWLGLCAADATPPAVWAAARDRDGPLRALHRGGGEVALLPNFPRWLWD